MLATSNNICGPNRTTIVSSKENNFGVLSFWNPCTVVCSWYPKHKIETLAGSFCVTPNQGVQTTVPCRISKLYKCKGLGRW